MDDLAAIVARSIRSEEDLYVYSTIKKALRDAACEIGKIPTTDYHCIKVGGTKFMMNRKEILDAADKCVNGDRQGSYGSPEDNFRTIADFWNAYLKKVLKQELTPTDVSAMMILLKISRIKSGVYKSDNWIDVAGYAACGGELQSMEDDDE